MSENKFDLEGLDHSEMCGIVATTECLCGLSEFQQRYRQLWAVVQAFADAKAEVDEGRPQYLHEGLDIAYALVEHLPEGILDEREGV